MYAGGTRDMSIKLQVEACRTRVDEPKGGAGIEMEDGQR
jgi:hypothetical protein